MLRIFKNLKVIDWLYLCACVGLIVLQVWLELKMPDYTANLTKAVSSGKIVQSEIWENGGMMLRQLQQDGFPRTLLQILLKH